MDEGDQIRSWPAGSTVAPLGYAGRTSRRQGAVGAYLSKPVGWALVSAAGITALVTAYAGSVPAGFFGMTLLVALAWGIIGIAWLVRLIAAVTAVSSAARPDDTIGSKWRWAIVPGVFILTIVACLQGVPDAVVFRLSRSALDRAAAAALARPAATQPVMSIGLYGTSTPEVENGTVYFRIDGAGYLDSEGFAYNPSAPPLPGYGQCRPLDGPWYWWHMKF